MIEWLIAMSNQRRKLTAPLFRFLLSSAFVLLIVLAGCSSQVQLHGSPYDPATAAPELGLANTNGDPFSLERQRGEIVLLYFGYTHCPDICPATLADLKWVHEQLANQSERLNVVFISIDPARDDPETLRQYLDRFQEDFIGLTGSEAQVAQAAAAYAVFAQRDPAEDDENYSMTHTSRVFLIDGQGLLRSNYTFDEPRDAILADVRQLLEG